MKTATPIRQGGFKSPNEEKEDDSIEAHLRQHARKIANLKGQIAETDYKTEPVQRQTAYLLHKNSKREEEEEKEKKRRRRSRNACNNLWLAQGSHA
jgi:septal ring factor EnvC (AmiA/AmiB activator)